MFLDVAPTEGREELSPGNDLRSWGALAPVDGLFHTTALRYIYIYIYFGTLSYKILHTNQNKNGCQKLVKACLLRDKSKAVFFS